MTKLNKIKHVKLANAKLLKLTEIVVNKINEFKNEDIDVIMEHNDNYTFKKSSNNAVTVKLTVKKSGNKITGYQIIYDSSSTPEMLLPHRYFINISNDFKVTTEIWNTLIFGDANEYHMSLSINYETFIQDVHFSENQYNTLKLKKIRNNFFSSSQLECGSIKDIQKKIFLSYMAFKNPQLIEEIFQTDDFDLIMNHPSIEDNINVLKMYQL